ncbi:Cytochrome P450 [Micromonospora viridifaciens]|uniref:Cytochrome P450 n=1 Tax=Micromonospora viridifaciens TaxID=1881 RepID=A0A1C4ZB17_MICVI|nr:cytochrome P450 [Micromonospora viridifaciens]SCF29931.1 Cytochrome P450 [Micromonospora viridifaciens]
MLFRGWGKSVDGPWPDVARVVDHVGVEHLVVTRHALVRRLLTDPETFRPDNALDAVTPIPVSALRLLAGHRFRLPPTLANNSAASHPEIRGIVADALHPARVAAQQPWLTGLVRQRVARLAAALDAGEPVDLYTELAADLPLLVLARLVELPDAPVGAVKDFARAALELFWAPLDEARQLALATEVGRFHTVLRAFAATSGGLAARLRDAGHSPDVVVGALFFLLVAGQETTSQFLTLLLHRLTGEPAVRAGLRAGQIPVADVVEEGLRLEPPIVTWRRVAGVDTTLGGTAVAAGTSIVAWLARAGRDPEVVAAPGEFRPGQRGSRRHLAFGAGPHRCVGAQLARMEAAVVVAEAAPLLDGVTVVRPPWCPDNLTFRMPDAFVVRRG